MRTRSRSRKKSHDESEFPIRVRYVVPALGLGSTYDRIYIWLDKHVGRADYAVNADSLPGVVDGISFYFRCSLKASQFAEMMEGEGVALADPRVGGWIRSG
ncbi:hypothetical protein J3R80_05885 [Aliiroseovarius sp. Z3]|uniref:hypothetical protein n=1 Tax=Aliiroseovarius sp. Z3 TaxID=2811402 RepID=UPI0023B2F9AD|nr:hypothetical protein [Aliiroseovarius sp. Z3]MDE9449997.1 hypothetical protein [Aliiroseovarius sp. Z3]